MMRTSFAAAIILGILLTAFLVTRANFSVVADDCVGTPAVTTDKDEYEHGETVLISGSGFECEAILTVKISAPDGGVTPNEVATDNTGEFTLAYHLDGIDGVFHIEILDADQAILAETTIAIFSHFRYGTLSWSPTGKPREVGESGELRFRLRAAFRRDAYSGSRCIPIGCSGSDGRPINGDIIIESQGPTQFNFGDGAISDTLRFLITGHDPVQNWVIGEALTIHPDGSSEIGILHTYPDTATDTFTAFLAGFANVPPLANVACCRIGQVGFGTTPPLANRAGLPYPLQTEVKIDEDPLLGNSSPVSGLPPIVSVPQSTAATFNVPATDPDGSVVTFRIATDAEAGGCCQPPGMVIGSTGIVIWDNSALNMNKLWTAQVMVEDGETKTPVDFLLRIVSGTPPAFVNPTPDDGTLVKVSVGELILIPLKAQDPDAGDTVSLNHAGIPPTATFIPGGVANPVEGSFQWTPQKEDNGTSTIVCFTATDNHGATSPPRCFVIEVTEDSDGDGIENDIDGFKLVRLRDPNNHFVSQAVDDPSNSFTDLELGGKTSGIVFDRRWLTHDVPPIPAHSGNSCLRASGPLTCLSDGTGVVIDSIVVHHCGPGDFGICVNEFVLPTGKSAHYVISRNGNIVKMVDHENAAFHATYYNNRSIGIEQEGSSGPDDFTDAMYESLANLIVKLHKNTGVPLTFLNPVVTAANISFTGELVCLDVPGIVGHRQVQPVSAPPAVYPCNPAPIDGKSDPESPPFNWDRLEDLINSRLNIILTGPEVSVVDARDLAGELDPAKGVFVRATGGEGGPASVVACDPARVVRLTAGDSLVITCDSLTAEVVSGPVEILFGEDIEVIVPNNTTVTITDVGNGDFEVENSPDSEGTVVIQFHGQEITLSPGEVFATVAVDIKPGSDPNSVECNNGREVIAIAILTTEEFDATTVDHTMVLFEGASEVHVNKKSGEPQRHEEDVDGDGDTDLVFHFRLGDTSLTCNSTEGILTGETFDGLTITGADAVRMIDQGGGTP